MRREDHYHWYFRHLYHQYIVDNYLKIEHQKLKFIELNQAKLRVEMYQGLVDAFSAADADLNHTGRVLVLPSTFVGGPRYMLNLFQDSMAIVREFGKPDLFITITCNPSWEEIQAELDHGLTPADIPDIIARIFKIKLEAIIAQLLKNDILGKVKAHMYVIEFQKRVSYTQFLSYYIFYNNKLY